MLYILHHCLYKIIGLDKSAAASLSSSDIVKKNSRQYLLALHPDKNKDPRAVEASVLVIKAKQVLGCTDTELSYRRTGSWPGGESHHKCYLSQQVIIFAQNTVAQLASKPQESLLDKKNPFSLANHQQAAHNSFCSFGLFTDINQPFAQMTSWALHVFGKRNQKCAQSVPQDVPQKTSFQTLGFRKLNSNHHPKQDANHKAARVYSIIKHEHRGGKIWFMVKWTDTESLSREMSSTCLVIAGGGLDQF